MTANETAHAEAAKYPHLNAEYFAYYAGRNAGEWGNKCEYTEFNLILAWRRGYRSICSEMRLDADTEWDA